MRAIVLRRIFYCWFYRFYNVFEFRELREGKKYVYDYCADCIRVRAYPIPYVRTVSEMKIKTMLAEHTISIIFTLFRRASTESVGITSNSMIGSKEERYSKKRNKRKAQICSSVFTTRLLVRWMSFVGANARTYFKMR